MISFVTGFIQFQGFENIKWIKMITNISYTTISFESFMYMENRTCMSNLKCQNQCQPMQLTTSKNASFMSEIIFWIIYSLSNFERSVEEYVCMFISYKKVLFLP